MTDQNLYLHKEVHDSMHKYKIQDNIVHNNSFLIKNSYLDGDNHLYQNQGSLSQYIQTKDNIPTKLNTPIKLRLNNVAEKEILDKPTIISPQINSNFNIPANYIQVNDDNGVIENNNKSFVSNFKHQMNNSKDQNIIYRAQENPIRQINYSPPSIIEIENLNLYNSQTVNNNRRRSIDIVRSKPCYSIINGSLNSARMSKEIPKENPTIPIEIVSSGPLLKTAKEDSFRNFNPSEEYPKTYIERYGRLKNPKRETPNSFYYPLETHAIKHPIPNQENANKVIYTSPFPSQQQIYMPKKYVIFPSRNNQKIERPYDKIIKSTPRPINNKPITSYIYKPDFQYQNIYRSDARNSPHPDTFYYAYYKSPRAIIQTSETPKEVRNTPLFLYHNPIYYQSTPRLNENVYLQTRKQYEIPENGTPEPEYKPTKFYPIYRERFYYY